MRLVTEIDIGTDQTSVLLVGGNGNMGRRYQAILNSMRVPYLIDDVGCRIGRNDYEGFSHILVATPTDTHADVLKTWSERAGKNVKFLCEKPITKNLDELQKLLDTIPNLSMMTQYKELVKPISAGPSFYDYFKHGSDGLVWDTMQTIGLARHGVEVQEKSPIWICKINGHSLEIGHMDVAYCLHVAKWIEGENQDPLETFEIHRKTAEYGKKCTTLKQ